MKIGIGASKRTIAGKKKDAGRSGIGIGITGIAHSSFIVGRRISNFPLSEIVLSATVMTGTTGLIGAIVIMVGNLLGRLEGGHPFKIGWGAGSAWTTGLEIMLSISLGTRKNLKRWLIHGFPMSSYFAGMPILIEWNQRKIVAQRSDSSNFLHGVQKD